MYSTKLTESGIEPGFGPFVPAVLKPYSRTRFATDGGALLKVYVGIEPEGRRLREATTIERAALRGTSVPAILVTGNGEGRSWTVFRTVAGKPCSTDTPKAAVGYIEHVMAVSGRLHRPTTGIAPGSGRGTPQTSPTSSRQFLLDQFSARCRWLPWWKVLAETLRPINTHRVVHLHGDLKPKHLLVDGKRLHVVDWEANACGPAVLDYTDVAFHLVRDLLYEGVPAGHVPIDLLTRLPFSGPVLAWRLLLWLDRRRTRTSISSPPTTSTNSPPRNRLPPHTGHLPRWSSSSVPPTFPAEPLTAPLVQAC